MAKISMVAREVKRAKLVAKYAAKRAELKKKANEGDYEACQALQALPKNASPVRLHNRCKVTGRPKVISVSSVSLVSSSVRWLQMV